MIAANVRHIDAVLYTHAHADHLHGIDDLRGFVIENRRRVPIWADAFTMARIRDGFRYCLESPPGSGYPPIVEPYVIPDDLPPLTIHGAGGPISFEPLMQFHGNVHSLGFRIGGFAYCSDVSDFPVETSRSSAGSICSSSTRCSTSFTRVTCPWCSRSCGSTVCAEARRTHAYACADGLRNRMRRDAGSRRAGLRHDAPGVRYRPADGG